ncbi:MAG: outer membrane protein transport protein [Prolixibacteraceae bacterium]|nr:outer membrane protein transport protein [Prolixibacteraceae bacterium]
MKKLAYILSIILISGSAFAQDLTDALRYSNYHIKGTARSTAMGNAFGALGGDFSSLSINPAGAGVYRSGEFTFTPSIGKMSVDGTYLGNTITESKYNMSIDNIGYVTTIPTGENSESGLVSLSFGLGFNKLASFSVNRLAEGANANHSILDYFTDNANNSGLVPDDLDPYYEQLAYDTDLMPYVDNVYFNDVTDNNFGQSQRKTTNRNGYINEYLVSFAANFNHKFYVGATLGIHDVIFKENANLFEWDEKNKIPYFNEMNFDTYLKTTGSGFNLKLGAIFKPVNNLRLGLAIHTPTFYKFNDEYDSYMTSSITYLDDGKTENYSAQPDKQGVYDYEIETPLRVIFSGAYVIGKSGLVSVDYELVDYSTAKLKNGGGSYDYYDENRTIQKAYKTTGNLHLGGEYRVNKSFSLRAGYENYASPFKSTYQSTINPNADANFSAVSAGFGYRQGKFFFDAAVKRSMNEDHTKLYPGAINMAKYVENQNNVIFTLGYKL